MCARRELWGDVYSNFGCLTSVPRDDFEILVRVAAQNHAALGAKGTD